MTKTRLHQFLSKTGLFQNKSKIIDAIKSSRIKLINQHGKEKIITNRDYQFNPNSESIFYNGKKIGAVKKKIYILVNKPENYLSSKLMEEDIKRRKKSIFELIKIDDKNIDANKKLTVEEKKTLFCIGRLDEDTSGLLILTNDGELSYKITNPENKIEKTYSVVLESPLDEKIIKSIESGVTITMEENGRTYKYKTRPFKITLNKQNRKNLMIKISEGKKREIRRIFESINNEVVKLKRISIGNINLDELKINNTPLTEGSYIFVDKEFIENRLKK